MSSFLIFQEFIPISQRFTFQLLFHNIFPLFFSIFQLNDLFVQESILETIELIFSSHPEVQNIFDVNPVFQLLKYSVYKSSESTLESLSMKIFSKFSPHLICPSYFSIVHFVFKNKFSHCYSSCFSLLVSFCVCFPVILSDDEEDNQIENYLRVGLNYANLDVLAESLRFLNVLFQFLGDHRLQKFYTKELFSDLKRLLSPENQGIFFVFSDLIVSIVHRGTQFLNDIFEIDVISLLIEHLNGLQFLVKQKVINCLIVILRNSNLEQINFLKSYDLGEIIFQSLVLSEDFDSLKDMCLIFPELNPHDFLENFF